jgi:probable HAF family extracellular repeat protein
MSFTRLPLCTAILVFVVSLGPAQEYGILDLGTFPGGSVSQGQAINVAGQVAGHARFSNYNAHGFYWTQKTGLVDLRSIPPKTNFSVAQAINSVGDIVGYSDYNELQEEHAVLWHHSTGTFVDLGTLPGGSYSQANSINDTGQIAGFSNSAVNSMHAVVWRENGGIEDLGALSGGYAQGIAVNVEGEVTGFSQTNDGIWHAILWNKSTGLRALPMLTAKDSSASGNGINNLGQVVGGSGNVAVLWQNNQNHTLQSLGVLSGAGWSTAFAINDVGQVVGWSGGAAFIWTKKTGMVDLNTLIPANSGWQLTLPTSINAVGQIVGQGNIKGTQPGFLLTPIH